MQTKKENMNKNELIKFIESRLSPEVFKELKLVKFSKGDVIFSEKSANNGTYAILSGLVKQFVFGIECRESIFKFCGFGDILGHRSLFLDKNHFDNAVCLSDVEVLHLPRAASLLAIKTDETLMHEFILRISEDSMQQIYHSQLLGQYNLQQRTAFGLLYLLSKNGNSDSREIFIGRDDFSNYIGAEKESVVRVMYYFKEEHLIESSGKRIRILKPEVLKKIAEKSIIKKAPLA